MATQGMEFNARYNIPPSHALLLCRNARWGGRELVTLYWGLVPSWAKDVSIGHRMINARSETVAEKPAFRTALRRRRCLIAADGFYEWRKGPGGRQPYYVRLKREGPFAFAGLWESWRSSPDEFPYGSCTILTTKANELVAQIHDRMPVILPESAFDTWMDPDLQDPATLTPLLQLYPATHMLAYPVSTAVNNPKNDNPSLIEPLPGSSPLLHSLQ